MKDELTEDQILRQDMVDNKIFQMVNALVPEKYRASNGNRPSQIEWDQSWIAEIRQKIQEYIRLGLGLDEDSTEFEREFYPFIEQ